MRSLPCIGGLLVAFAIGLVNAQLAQQPKADEPRAVFELLEDDNEALVRQMNNDGGLDATKIQHDFRDFYSGVASVRVTPFQRFSSRLGGWNYPIVEKPGPGQYRYLRFAWKREGGAGIMIQLHANNGSWNQRYYAGAVSAATNGWGAMLRVTDKLPAEWELVTRDLYKDYGAFTITGLALTPMDGGAGGRFDHMYLGRTIEDLDTVTAAAFAKTPLKDPLPRERLEQLWQELGDRDVKTAAPALRTLLAGRKDSVPFLKERWKAQMPKPDVERIARLITDLDDARFVVREKATVALDKLGVIAVPFLEKAARETTSGEVRQRAERLLTKHRVDSSALTPEQLRLVRLIRLLEWSALPEARTALDELARSPLEAGLSEDARRALARMGK